MMSRVNVAAAVICVVMAAFVWVVADAWLPALILLGFAIANGIVANENRKAGR